MASLDIHLYVKKDLTYGECVRVAKEKYKIIHRLLYISIIFLFLNYVVDIVCYVKNYNGFSFFCWVFLNLGVIGIIITVIIYYISIPKPDAESEFLNKPDSLNQNVGESQSNEPPKYTSTFMDELDKQD
ncbi:Schizosaccharomyces pombe specific protein [Schizosaccharomyces pombe]|uniref:Putative uncharacterized membrane protein C622.07 n=1 Tax=Schizosaccharomyces pombe (strain 972 / ATCC 24843) TaxID=284812 RepID=YC87_SCHPO|nr:uncharacterized protein SPCC622.07 [Schizosaccharomyces pombe]O94597.1 RecName: Full=Putative uncharacterized membrane protein C622.07 [Schizosaccharomyces pombe 972h-]CAA21863.1 dubious [Schizosaccharomyces pombe]|eukprot:NP_588179.1 uncharacterized protein SPCC622.07 [Schizosaccharomyces pombe]